MSFFSTNRGLFRRRRVPKTSFPEMLIEKYPSYMIMASFSKLNEFNTIKTRNIVTTSLSNTYRNVPTEADGSAVIVNKRPSLFAEAGGGINKIDTEDVNHSPVKDFDPSALNGKTAFGECANDRIWIDMESSLERRVDLFINQPLGSIHHLDIRLTSPDLIAACGKQKSFQGMKNAQGILDRLIEEKKYVNNLPETTTFVIIPDRPFQLVMFGWVNMCRKVTFATKRMREVLDLMIQEADYDKKFIERAHSFTVQGQSCHCDSNEGDNDRQSLDILQNDLFGSLSCEPTVDIYNTLLQGLSQAATRSIQAAIEAEHALSRMDKMNKKKGWHTKPNTRSYSLVLNAYVNSRHVSAGNRAESVLRNMTERHEHEKQEYFEDYNVEYNTLKPELNKRKIVTPDTIAYTMVIQAHGSSGLSGSAEKAFVLLNELIHSDNPVLKPDSFSFANTINAFSKMAAEKKSPKQRVGAAERAEQILWVMVEEIKKNEHSDQLSGSIVPFNACLNAWAQSSAPESPAKAEDLLHRMLDPHLQSIIQVQPNTLSFNTCMQAWLKACTFKELDVIQKAEDLFNLLKKLSTEGMTDKKWDFSPDTQSYAIVMNAYASSQKVDSVVHTRRLLSDLIQARRERYFYSGVKDKINAQPFTIVLKAAANAKRNKCSSGEVAEFTFGPLHLEDEHDPMGEPYAIAWDTYYELLNDTFDLGVSADHFTFSMMLTVIAEYTVAESIERRQRVEEVFQDACNSGQLSSLVIRAMQKACPNDIMLADLLRLRGNNAVTSIESINTFPKQWTSHVPREFYRVNNRKDHFQKQSKFNRTKK